LKGIIFGFLIALLLSCLLNSIVFDVPPSPVPVGIGDSKAGSLGLTREEADIPEINYTQATHPNRYMTGIDDKSPERNVEWPLGANN
jgi:hypothetical protein